MCILDSDCSSTLICFQTSWSNTTLLQQQQQHPNGLVGLPGINNGTGLCGCNYNYGFDGSNCEGFGNTPQSKFYLAFAGLFIIWSFIVGVGLALVDVIQYWKDEKSMKLDIFSVASLQVTASFLLLVVEEGFMIAALTQPENAIAFNSGSKVSIWYFPSRIAVSLEICFGGLALVTIPMIWGEITLTMRALKPFRSDRFKSCHKPMIAFEILFFTCVFIPVVIGNPVVAQNVSTGYIIFIFICYIWAAFQMGRMLFKAASSDSEDARKSARAAVDVSSSPTSNNTNNTTNNMTKRGDKFRAVAIEVYQIATVYCIVDGIGFAFVLVGQLYSSQERELSPPGEVSVLSILYILGKICLHGSVTIIEYHLHSTFVRKRRAKRQGTVDHVGDAQQLSGDVVRTGA
jgi:hypothetical protein